MRKPVGLFITGNDTDVGKTHVAAMIARAVVASGARVGVYKPAGSACRMEDNRLVSDDAVELSRAAGSPGDLEHVCPQRFAAPLAPHLAAVKEGKALDSKLLRSGLDYWRERSDFLLIEGAGGLMSPMSDSEYVADLARDFGYPLLIVARNQIGVINQTIQTLIAARTIHEGPAVAGIMLNRAAPPDNDPSVPDNRRQLEIHCDAPLLAEVAFGQTEFRPVVDWLALAARLSERPRAPFRPFQTGGEFPPPKYRALTGWPRSSGRRHRPGCANAAARKPIGEPVRNRPQIG